MLGSKKGNEPAAHLSENSILILEAKDTKIRILEDQVN